MTSSYKDLTTQNDVPGLERLYRQAEIDGEISAFKDAIEHCIKEQPEDPLFLAWAYRLDLLPTANIEQTHSQRRHWQVAIGISIALGILFVLLAGNKPPLPFPDMEGETKGRPHFWLGWSPFVALAMLAFMAIQNRIDVRHYGIAGIAISVIATIMAFSFWNQTGHLAILVALHLPFVIWALLGGGIIKPHKNLAIQFHAFSVKSVETILTGGIYFGTGMIFLMLTYGIFQALGIEIAEGIMLKAVTWNLGATMLLAFASVYDPTTSPAAQNWTSGLTRLLGILTRLLLPLTLVVLVIYIFYFIPAYFWRPFEEREVLIVYNATIMAILVLIALAIADTDTQTHQKQPLLRHALRILGILTGLLNIYALAAIIYRINAYGITPNRYAVIGWNVITLLMLTVIVIAIWRAQEDIWTQTLRESIARVSILSIIWALAVLFILPLSFH